MKMDAAIGGVIGTLVYKEDRIFRYFYEKVR